ncbi:MAG: HAD-IIB family hydrolase [Bifidobacteriaceae bacterium]|jgi:HAD superfamily hydrolase (TIGR01484 family)|nr:HAD-IIB family hydrolase [Bifidobacteriaceae bacterium]
MHKLYAFDLDGTLALSKSKVSAFMSQSLSQLLDFAQICIISGGKYEQFEQQLLAYLDPLAHLEKLHIMPTCGTRYYKWSGKAETLDFEQVYARNLTDSEIDKAVKAIEYEAKRLGLWEEKSWGGKIENRGSQITFSALGQEAPVDQKERWDPNNTKKNKLREAVALHIPNLEVRSGGSTSIDITKKGIDKAYGMKELKKITGIEFRQMLFFGDRLDKEGNDYPVKELGIESIEVNNPDHTLKLVKKILNDFESGKK